MNRATQCTRLIPISSTDDFTTALGLVARPGIRIFGGLQYLSRESDKLLQEFFETCREPNAAEAEMLARACRIPTIIVFEWCKY